MRLLPSSFRILGLAFLALGMIVTSMAFIAGEGEGFILIFPFVFGNVDGWPAVALTIGSTAFFIIAMFLPFVLLSRENRFMHHTIFFEESDNHDELTDYIITLDVPEELRRTLFIEGNQGDINLGSSAQPFFRRSYKLPEGFEVDGYHHEFDDRFLVLKLKLKRRIY
jgi:hypothetical protein